MVKVVVLNGDEPCTDVDLAALTARVAAIEDNCCGDDGDPQTLSVDGDQLTISGGNTVELPTGDCEGHFDIFGNPL